MAPPKNLFLPPLYTLCKDTGFVEQYYQATVVASKVDISLQCTDVRIIIITYYFYSALSINYRVQTE